jgi:hypothetical protein
MRLSAANQRGRATATAATKTAHGPFVDDDSEWYVMDALECPGLGLIDLNPQPDVVPTKQDDVSPML